MGDPQPRHQSESGVETPGGPALDVLTKNESLGGDGTPAVAAFTPEPFALKLGISPAAGAQLIADALDLRHRLPLLWKRVQRLQVPTWQARRVAQQTHTLPLAGARWVDHRLATRTDGSLGPVITDRLVALATAKYDPETHQQREAAATAASEVTLSHPHPTLYTGTSDLAATGDTPVLQGFYDLLCAIAHQLWLDGDTDPLGVRKIKAIALITTLATGQATRDAAVGLGAQQSPSRRPARSGSTSSSTPTTSTPTPKAEPPSRSAPSNASARPPSPSSANGSATTKSRSSRS